MEVKSEPARRDQYYKTSFSLRREQADRMSLRKDCSIGTPTLFVKVNSKLYQWKKYPYLCMRLKNNVPKINNRPIGENSPNLVTPDVSTSNQILVLSEAFKKT
jgi:hypothetical protein